MSKVYIQLGKLGDVLNILPVMKEIGNKPTLMVSTKYAPVLDGVSYVNPRVFSGQWHELGKAVNEVVKEKLPFAVTQVCGHPADTLKYVYEPNGTDKAITDCWQKESYRAAGQWQLWRKQPRLVFDRRSQDREKTLIDKFVGKKPVILVSAGGESAPFQCKALLMELLKHRFGKKFQILDLEDIVAERFYDLLGLYDLAHCLISADTAHLHLAQASDLMVVALSNDKPSYWHGSAWRPQHASFIRYSDFGQRAVEMLDKMEMFLSGKYEIQLKDKLHVWSQYDLNSLNINRHLKARESWDGMTDFCIQKGSCGRDSSTAPINDKERYPYVRDVLQQVEMLLPKGLVVLSGPDVTFDKGVDQQGWASRIEVRNGVQTFNPRPDVLAFQIDWWRKVRDQFPDMIMGPDNIWKKTLKDLIRRDGGVDLTGTVTWHE